MIGILEFPGPTSFADVLPGRFQLIATITWSSSAAVVSDGKSGFESLVRYPLDGKILEGIPVDALSSGVWADLIAVDDVDLSCSGSHTAKRVRHVSDVFLGLNSLHYSPIMGESLDVDFWRYQTFGERPCVASVYTLSAAQSKAWVERFIVYPDAICLKNATLVGHFRHDDWAS